MTITAFSSPAIEKILFIHYNIGMTLNDIFKANYGKDWKQASFMEKLEAVVFGAILIHFLAALLPFKS
jgi:hypothetical protein